MKTRIIAGCVAVVGALALFLYSDRRSASPEIYREARLKGSADQGALKHESVGHTDPSAVTMPERRLPKLSGAIKVAKEKMGEKLSYDQAVKLNRLYAELVREREKIELEVATTETVDENSVMITIPPYAERGLMLYGDFHDKMGKELGEDVAKEINAAMDPRFRAENGDFGVEEQLVLVEKNGDTFDITHGSGFMTKVNNEINMAQLTTRSNVLSSNLLRYTYLKSKFPKSGGN